MVMKPNPNMCVPFAPQTSPAPRNKETALGALYCQTSEGLALSNPNHLGKWKRAVEAAEGAIFLIVLEACC